MDNERIIEAVWRENADETAHAAVGAPITTTIVALAMGGVCPECGGTDERGGLFNFARGHYICTNPYHDHREALEAMLDE